MYLSPLISGWDYYEVGENAIAVNTSGLEEKAAACNMLFCYTVEMKAGFFPWIEQVGRVHTHTDSVGAGASM